MLPSDRKSNAWLKYSGLGVQLAVTIGACIALGWWLDNHFGWTPFATIVLSLVGVCGGIYLAVRDFL